MIIRTLRPAELGKEQKLSEDGGPYFFLTSSDMGLDDMKISSFQKAYGLTQAETEVAILLAGGQQPLEISHSRNANMSTIRTQIKMIKNKTGCRNIPDIVRLVCGFSASMFISSQVSSVADSYTHMISSAKRMSTLVLRDGRRMAYLEQGAPDGTPVIFIHNMMFGAELTDEGAQAAARLNLRILTPFRPGFGRSDPAQFARGDKLLNLVAKDLNELLDHHNIPKAVVLGQTVGSIYAMRFARLYPNKVSHLFAVSYAPLWKEEWMKSFPKTQRIIARIARFTPRILPLLTRTVVAQIDQQETLPFIRNMYKNSKEDMWPLSKPDVAAQVKKGFETHVAQGEEAFCRDVLFNVTDYSEEAKHLKTPFHILHGDADKTILLSRVLEYAERVPGTTVEVVNGAGQFLLHSHWQHVLNAIKTRSKAD